MPSLIELAAIALLLQAGAPPVEEPQGTGPRGSSQPTAGEERYDAIGYATIAEGSGITVSATGLPGDFAEVTSIATGKTIVAIVASDAPPPGRIAVLSRSAAQALGIAGDPAGIRVRPINPPGPEIAGLRAGQANARADAPPALIAALRRKLGPAPAPLPVRRMPAAVTPPPPTMTPRPRVATPVPPPSRARPSPTAPAPAAARPVTTAAPAPVLATAPASVPGDVLTPGFYVQYAALSSRERATTLAETVRGVVERTDAIYRVHRGPYATDAEAKRERARAVSLGYRDAQIVRIIP